MTVGSGVGNQLHAACMHESRWCALVATTRCRRGRAVPSMLRQAAAGSAMQAGAHTMCCALLCYAALCHAVLCCAVVCLKVCRPLQDLHRSAAEADACRGTPEGS
jgi:hypothetical protein